MTAIFLFSVHVFQNVSKLRTANIKPYIIFAAAPNMERLKTNMRENCGIEPIVSLVRYTILVVTDLNNIQFRDFSSSFGLKLSNHEM